MIIQIEFNLQNLKGESALLLNREKKKIYFILSFMSNPKLLKLIGLFLSISVGFGSGPDSHNT